MGGRGHWRSAWLASAAALPLLTAQEVHAAADPAAPAPAAAGESAPPEIVVTATRQSQTLSKVPESVSAFTAAQMEVQGVKSMADLAKFTPGITYNEERHDVAIRGIISTAGSGTTGIYIDDTPIQVRALGLNANNTLPAVFDLDRVEVLRGPQGTLFGAGSEGGTVRYITPQPSLTGFSGYAHSEVAETVNGAPSYELGAAAGGPIIEDVLGFRVSAWGRRDGGWINRVDDATLAPTERDANWVGTTVLRAALAWRPLASLLVTPSIYYQNRVQNDYDQYWVSISDPGAGDFRSGTPDRMADKDWFVLPSIKAELDLPSVKLISNTAFYDRLEHVNGYSGTLYDLSYFQQLTGAGIDPQGAPCAQCASDPSPLLLANGLNLPGFGKYLAINLITNSQENFTQEFRAQSADPSARLTWITGVFWSFDTQRSTEEIKDPQLPALTEYLWGESMLTAWGETLLPNGDDYLNATTSHDEQAAAFLDATYAVSPALKLNLGLRYAWTHFDYHNLNDGPQDLLDDGGVAAVVAGGRSETPFTPKVNATYQITRDDMVYGTISDGYRIGGATPPLPAAACGGVFPTSYKSDTTTNYEIGTKDRFLDRTVQVEASVYYIQWKNIQQAVYVPQCGIQYTTNLGNAVSKGFDVQGQWRVMRGWRLEGSLGYTDAQFSTDAVEQVSGVPLVLARKGDALNVTPFTLALGSQYDFSLYGEQAFVRGDYEFNSKRTTPIPDEDPRISPNFYDPGLVPDPATHQVSARAGITLRAWEVELYANNLLNAHPRLDLNHEDQYTLLYEATTFRPLTIGLSASYKY